MIMSYGEACTAKVIFLSTYTQKAHIPLSGRIQFTDIVVSFMYAGYELVIYMQA